MNEYRKIWANARYEIITLLRGWFFRIFAGATILIFLLINILFFSGVVPVPRIFNGFSGAIPYANMIMLNIAQMAVIIFMASDFYKRDQKFNTAEVYYIRSMTNTTYLLGKALGVFILFTILNILVLLTAAIIHIVFSNTNFNGITYLLYPLLIGFPAFIFMIGLSFLLMHLIRNQAVVVLLLLGYYAAVLFYLYDKWHYIFDVIAVKIPMIYSDFIGLADLERILLQRGLYLSFGILCILLSILLFKRLAQSKFILRIVLSLAVFFLIVSVYCILSYVGIYRNENDLRTRMIALNEQYIGQPNITPLSCKIDFYHQGSSFRATASYVFSNQSEKALNQFVYSINPGLKVEDIRQNDTKVTFVQKDHIIDIKD